VVEVRRVLLKSTRRHAPFSGAWRFLARTYERSEYGRDPSKLVIEVRRVLLKSTRRHAPFSGAWRFLARTYR